MSFSIIFFIHLVVGANLASRSLKFGNDPNPIPLPTLPPRVKYRQIRPFTSPTTRLRAALDLPNRNQASTGMTTGSWLVSFGLDLEDALDAVEEELREAYVIPAMVQAMDTAADGYWMLEVRSLRIYAIGISLISAYIRFVSRKMLQPNLSVEIMLNLTFGVLEICGPWFIFYVNFSRNRRSARRVNLFGRAFSRTAKNCGRGSASRRCAESRKAFACWFRWFLKVQGWWLQESYWELY